MKSLEQETNSSITADECASLLMDTIPQMMRFLRAEMRSRGTELLSVSQFRTLAFVNRHQGASLSDVAEHIGLALPSMSKLIDGLVARQLVSRMESPTDRRRLCLSLTKRGEALLNSARQGTQASLAALLSSLSPAERQVVAEAIQVLRPLFLPAQEAQTEAAGSENAITSEG